MGLESIITFRTGCQLSLALGTPDSPRINGVPGIQKVEDESSHPRPGLSGASISCWVGGKQLSINGKKWVCTRFTGFCNLKQDDIKLRELNLIPALSPSTY